MITYISGGERSGKSSFAQTYAKERSHFPVFLATARILDSEMESRINRHKTERDSAWDLIEEPLFLSRHKLQGRVVLLDCVTLWLANVFYDHERVLDDSLAWAKKEWDIFSNQNFDLIVVSNEIGMGLHGNTEEARLFTQLQGFVNQHIAKNADEAWFMVSGLPLKVK